MSTRRVFDISPPLVAGMPIWPGDAPLEVRWTVSLARGEGANVSEISTTTHLGAHVEAPFHTESEGDTLDSVPLEVFVGPCRVVEVPAVPLLLPEHLPSPISDDPPRLLFKTRSVADRARFPASYTAVSRAAGEILAARGLRLLGLDTPSFDPLDSHDLGAHHALLGAGVVLLEGLVLDDVPAGLYELIALPLKLIGVDASPVRALLREA